MFFERRPHHGLIAPEELRTDVIKAVAGIVISKDGKLLIGTEQIDKPATQKKHGDASIPFETLKPSEVSQEGSFVGALLTEITTDEAMPNLRGKLDSAGIVDQVEVFPGDWVATLLLRYRGKSDSMPFRATHPEEFSSLRWETLDEARSLPNLRPYAVPILERYAQLMNDNQRKGLNFRSLYLDHYTPTVFEAARQMEPDVEVGGLANAMSVLLTKEIPYKL